MFLCFVAFGLHMLHMRRQRMEILGIFFSVSTHQLLGPGWGGVSDASWFSLLGFGFEMHGTYLGSMVALPFGG